MKHLTKEQATQFFSAFYGGEHHIPSEVKSFGYGWAVIQNNEIATYDFNAMTRLVVMAHDLCVRVEVSAVSKHTLKVAIWKRQREGAIYKRHPTLEQAVPLIRKQFSFLGGEEKFNNGQISSELATKQ